MNNDIIIGYHKTLTGFIGDAKVIFDIVAMAMYYTGKNLFKNVTLAKALEPFVYAMYHNMLDDYMKTRLEYLYPYIQYDPHSKEFDSSEYDPLSEIQSIAAYCETHEDFRQDVFDWFWISRAIMLLKLPIPNWDVSKFFIRARELNKLHQDYAGSPTFMIPKNSLVYLWYARDRIDEEHRAKWAMHIAILSIIGNKSYASTTSEAIKCRMFGCKNKEELKIALQDERTKKLYDKWTSRRRYDRLLQQLQIEGYIKEFGERRKTFVTTKLTLEELVKTVSTTSKQNQLEELRKTKAALRAKYMK